MSAVKDDLLQTIVSIAFARSGHISTEFARAIREGQAEMESEFEAESFAHCSDCGGEIRGAEPDEKVKCIDCDPYTKADYDADQADERYGNHVDDDGIEDEVI